MNADPLQAYWDGRGDAERLTKARVAELEAEIARLKARCEFAVGQWRLALIGWKSHVEREGMASIGSASAQITAAMKAWDEAFSGESLGGPSPGGPDGEGRSDVIDVEFDGPDPIDHESFDAAHEPGWTDDDASVVRSFLGREREAAAPPDNVNSPAHYTCHSIEAIDVIEDWKLGFCLGNAVKYISRHQHKGNPVEDLRKARWYLDRAVTSLEARR